MGSDHSDGITYHHPANEDEVIALVRQARADNALLRVRGSAHSVPEAIYAPHDTGRPTVHLLLDRMIAASFDDTTRRATAQAGCHLGKDPSDPTRSSTWENGLFPQIDARGWAVPDMGGIIHQSVGGFLSTASSGGSLLHSIYDAIVAVRLVDGTGNVRTFHRDEGGADNPFFATVPSMGLLGVITEVTFQCLPRYHVIGTETTHDVDKSPIDLFGDGPTSLRAWAERTEHVRALWWPQRGVERVTFWEARRMEADDYNAETGTPDAFRPRKYELMEKVFGSRKTAQTLANKVFRTFGRLNPPPPRSLLSKLTDRTLAGLYAPTIKAFLPTGEKSRKRFWDLWWKALPMDNEASDTLLPTEFTEAWIPLGRAHEAMVALRELFRKGGFLSTGTHATELYVGKKSPFWLSPGFGEHTFRIDLFWFAKNEGHAEKHFYPQHWELLEPYQPRYHWGKHLPVAPAALRPRFPRWDDFLRLRAQLDPDGIFLTPYWKERLGI